MIIIYVDIILIAILMALTIGTCVYCVYHVYDLQQRGVLTQILKPTKVVFSHHEETGAAGELRSVVAYRNPLTGDYCVHKSHVTGGYSNQSDDVSELPSPSPSTDSGVSDEYEPCLEPNTNLLKQMENSVKAPPTTYDENSVDRPRNWNYKEYQI